MKPEDELEERATLVRQDETLKILVRRKDGSVLGERSLSAASTCEELETLASVVLATWISDVHPEFVATLPPAPASGVMPDETTAAAAAPSPASAPTENQPAPSTPPAPPPAVSPGQPWHWELGAAAGADFSGGRISALGSAGVRFMPERYGVGAALALHLMTPRTEDLSQGSVRYWRWPLVLGPALRLPLGDARVDLHAGAALAWVRAQGQNFMPAETRDEFRGGGLVGLRGAYGAGRWKGFVELSGVLWGRTEAFIRRGDQSPAIGLPRAELYATLGASWAP